MRIVGEIVKGDIKITIFSYNDKLSLKLEWNLLEQIYKFRDGSGINTLNDVHLFCSDSFIQKCQDIFNQMNALRYESIIQISGTDNTQFPEII